MIKDADIDGDGKINYEGNIWDSYNFKTCFFIVVNIFGII
jgi:hypothetical protein